LYGNQIPVFYSAEQKLVVETDSSRQSGQNPG